MTPASRPDARTDDGIGLSPLLYLLFCVVALLPFLLVAQPPIMDFANHAARLEIACAIADPQVSEMYRMHFGLIPNLAIDLINVPFCGLVSAPMLLRLIMAAALTAIFVGCWRLQATLFGRATVMLLFVPAMAMNLVTSTGYINYLIGIAVAVNLVAQVVARPPRMPAMIALGNLAGIVLFFCHIFALALTMVLFFGHYLRGAGWRPAALVRAGLCTLATFALPILAMPFVASDDQGLLIAYAAKPRTLLAPVMTYNYGADLFGMLILAVCVYLCWRGGHARIAQAMRLPLLALALYVVAMPAQLQSAIDLDSRTMVALAWLFVAGFGVVVADRGVARMVALGAAGLLVVHGAVAATSWRRFDRQVTELRAAFAPLPAQALVLTFGDAEVPTGRNTLAASPVAYTHLTSYATLDRHVFNPLEFTGVGMQPLSAVGRFAAYDIPVSSPIPVATAKLLAAPDATIVRRATAVGLDYALNWPRRFDYAVHYHFGDAAILPWPGLHPIHRGSFFTIYRIDHPVATGGGVAAVAAPVAISAARPCSGLPEDRAREPACW